MATPIPDRETISVPPDGRPLSEQPAWRQDFPIDWPQDEYVERRDFVKFLTLTSLALRGHLDRRQAVSRAGASARRRRLAAVTDLAVAGRWCSTPCEHDSTCSTIQNRVRRVLAKVHAPVMRGASQTGAGHLFNVPGHEGVSTFRTGRQRPARRRVRCRASCLKFTTARSLPPPSRSGSRDQGTADLHARAAHADRARYARLRFDPRRAATVAADGDDERLSGRGWRGRLARCVPNCSAFC